jgi:hypothetical protein
MLHTQVQTNGSSTRNLVASLAFFSLLHCLFFALILRYPLPPPSTNNPPSPTHPRAKSHACTYYACPFSLYHHCIAAWNDWTSLIAASSCSISHALLGPADALISFMYYTAGQVSLDRVKTRVPSSPLPHPPLPYCLSGTYVLAPGRSRQPGPKIREYRLGQAHLYCMHAGLGSLCSSESVSIWLSVPVAECA